MGFRLILYLKHEADKLVDKEKGTKSMEKGEEIIK